MGRFTNLPQRLREMRERMDDPETEVDLPDWLNLSSLLCDAALKIEALERETKRNSKEA